MGKRNVDREFQKKNAVTGNVAFNMKFKGNLIDAGVVDLEKEMFTRESIEQAAGDAKGKELPLLWNQKPIGKVSEIDVVDTGLFVSGVIDINSLSKEEGMLIDRSIAGKFDLVTVVSMKDMVKRIDGDVTVIEDFKIDAVHVSFTPLDPSLKPIEFGDDD